MMDYINAVPPGQWVFLRGIGTIFLIGWIIFNMYCFINDHRQESLGKRIWLAIQLNLLLPLILIFGLIWAIFTTPLGAGSWGWILFFI